VLQRDVGFNVGIRERRAVRRLHGMKEAWPSCSSHCQAIPSELDDLSAPLLVKMARGDDQVRPCVDRERE